MSGQRATWASAERLMGQLSDRDWLILMSLQAARLLTGDQMTRLHFDNLSSNTQHRTRRRVMQRLHQLKIVSRLDRLVGGVRAGSTGWVYALDVLGHRLLQLQAGDAEHSRLRHPWTPGRLFTMHALAIGELYVQLTEASRSHSFELATFQTEPACWWPDGLGGYLKPDAFAVLSTDSYDELFWVEVDRGTESLPTLRRKIASYVNFVERGQLGPRQVLPHVLVTTPNEQRRASVSGLLGKLGDPQIFTVCEFDKATLAITELAGVKPP
jgi:hypothetical protein